MGLSLAGRECLWLFFPQFLSSKPKICLLNAAKPADTRGNLHHSQLWTLGVPWSEFPFGTHLNRWYTRHQFGSQPRSLEEPPLGPLQAEGNLWQAQGALVHQGPAGKDLQGVTPKWICTRARLECENSSHPCPKISGWFFLVETALRIESLTCLVEPPPSLSLRKWFGQ